VRKDRVLLGSSGRESGSVAVGGDGAQRKSGIGHRVRILRGVVGLEIEVER
jgi:hypothetical protein